MPASPARTAAFQILLRVQKEDAYASELLHSDLLQHLSAADRGLCTEIVFGVLRWQSALDLAIAAVSDKQPKSMDPEVLIALRMAAYQIRFLDRVPARAAVNESVELVKAARKRSAVGFANAVLRNLASSPPEITARTPVEELAQRLAHPLWLVARWMESFGVAATQKICEYDQRVAETVVRIHELNRPTETHTEIIEELRKEGIETRPGLVV